MGESVELEYRVARLFSSMGYFSRRGLPLKSYFYPEQVDVTDIDVYGIKWNYDFSADLVISQCKTGKSKQERKPANPILWLRGLRELMKASQAYLVMPQITPKLKDFARTNGIIPLDYQRLDELEAKLGNTAWQGSYAIDNFQRLSEYYGNIKKESRSEISHHYWFLVSDFWALPNNIRIKKCISHLDSFLKLMDNRFAHHGWLLIESIILLSVALLGFCHELSPFNRDERKRYIEVKMIEGLGTIEDQEKILGLISSLATAVAEEKTGQRIFVRAEEVRIPPPEYTSRLVELIERILDKPTISVNIPRFMDFFLYESVVRQQDVKKEELCSLFHINPDELDILAKLSKNITRFVDEKCEERPVLKSLMLL